MRTLRLIRRTRIIPSLLLRNRTRLTAKSETEKKTKKSGRKLMRIGLKCQKEIGKEMRNESVKRRKKRVWKPIPMERALS